MSIESAIKSMSPEVRKGLADLLIAMNSESSTEENDLVDETEGTVNETENVAAPEPRDPFQMRDNSALEKGNSPVPKMNSTWVDDGTEHEDQKTEDKPKKKVQRNRPRFQRVEKICSICGGKEMAYPGVAYGKNYRCNSCIGG